MEAEVGENVDAARIVMSRISVASWVRGGQSRDQTFSCLPELGRGSGREEGKAKGGGRGTLRAEFYLYLCKDAREDVGGG